ncbi:cytidylyltransferase family protein [Acidianus sp. HS-5]|uniref:cytidylyltransferase family protein n=1 Tax=Acidianus sp. HS-5 TaxID=2886040 RepID=UPI001F3D629D|nr:cytidylyltransferase family protein [Acidianus sp. HS-5]BDC19923.1 cytidyltransferase [Acidianus sp. HS-5]
MSSLKDRVIKYIKGMNDRLSKINIQEYQKIIDLARQYTEDAKYYLDKGDVETAIVDIAYAEGLLDAILISTNKDPDSDISKKVFVGGTFDIIHPGHIEFLREASRLGRVYVSVARDKNSEKIKGRKPINDEEQRLEVVKNIRYVYDAFLGDEKDFIKSVERVKPDIIFLGPDQHVNIEEFKKDLEKRGINAEIVRMPERVNKWKHSSTTSIINEIISRYCKS